MNPIDWTYAPKLNNALIRFVQDEHRKRMLPLPMFKLRRRYLKAKGVNWDELSAIEKEHLRLRFSYAINNLEGSFITSNRVPNGTGIPIRIIDYLKDPNATN
ncbi:MAG: hypothetical protein K9G46_07025 [Flavobacteriales bacterium]|nr:hypothetical protein [Flavobacteriales bacterium]